MIDDAIEEYEFAELLDLPIIDPNEEWTVDGIIDAYGELYGEEELSKLLYIFSSEGAGLGFSLEKASFWFDGWDVDHSKKIIYIDDEEVFSSMTNSEAAQHVKRVVFREAERKENIWDSIWRVTKGSVKVVIGGAEIFSGGGVIVPEPGTTVTGVALIAYGTSTVTEGFTQVFNINDGEGINPIEEGFAFIGRSVNGDIGEDLARMAFTFSNIVVSLGGKL